MLSKKECLTALLFILQIRGGSKPPPYKAAYMSLLFRTNVL